jgi:hypothetical protein
MTNNLSNPTYTVSGQAGVVTTQVNGSTITVTPATNGSTTLLITDNASKQANEAVTVAIGPLSATPTTLSFQYVSSASQILTISDPGFSGTYTASTNPTGIVSNVISGASDTVSPLAVGTTTITISDGTQTKQIVATVGAGPIAGSPATLNFTSLTGNQTITITDPGFSGTFTANTSPTGIVSTSVNSNQVIVTPLANGTTTILLSDGISGNVFGDVATVAAPAPSSTPVWQLAQVTQSQYPYPVTLPTPGVYTFYAEYESTTTSSSGQSVAALTGAWDLDAGEFPGTSTTNSIDATGHHFYTSNNGGVQSSPAYGLSTNTVYMDFASYSGVSLQLITCTITPTVSCTAAPAVTLVGNQAYTSTQGYIGADDSTGTRLFDGPFIWNLGELPTALTLAQATTYAQANATSAPATPAPSPSPTASGAPSSGLCPQNPGSPPILITWSACFTGNSPFHHTIAALKTAGATVDTSGVLSTWWSQGTSGSTLNQTGCCEPAAPLYLGNSSASAFEPAYSYSCNGQEGTCPTTAATSTTPGSLFASGVKGYFGSGAQPEEGEWDNHLSMIVTVAGGYEADGWLCGNAIGTSNDQITNPIGCATGGVFPLASNGVDESGKGTGYCLYCADAGGYAFGIELPSAADFVNYYLHGTHIGHAGGITVKCVGTTGGVYPSYHNADAACSGAPVYGENLHFIGSVSGRAGSNTYCAALLQQGADYGFYIGDTNSSGTNMNMEYVETYSVAPYNTITNPYTSGYGGAPAIVNSISTSSTCLQLTQQSDWEFVKLNQNGDSALPAAVPYGTSG